MVNSELEVNKDVVAVLKMPDVVDVLAQNGMVPLPSTAEHFGTFLKEEIKKILEHRTNFPKKKPSKIVLNVFLN